jgi:hypothetical protein
MFHSVRTPLTTPAQLFNADQISVEHGKRRDPFSARLARPFASGLLAGKQVFSQMDTTICFPSSWSCSHTHGGNLAPGGRRPL